jgi:hypothetical protein
MLVEHGDVRLLQCYIPLRHHFRVDNGGDRLILRDANCPDYRVNGGDVKVPDQALDSQGITVIVRG